MFYYQSRCHELKKSRLSVIYDNVDKRCIKKALQILSTI